METAGNAVEYTVETVKYALGYGSGSGQADAGQEPVSGEGGKGTAGEPYDTGNVQDPNLGGKAPQHTGTESVEDKPKESETATSATVMDQPGPQQDASSSMSDPQPSSTEAAASPPDNKGETDSAANGPEKAAEKPSIGSSGWFPTSLPYWKRQEEKPKASEPSGTGDAAATNGETIEQPEKSEPSGTGDAAATNGETTEQPERVPEKTPEKAPEKSSIGSSSWFASAIPYGRRKEEQPGDTQQRNGQTANDTPAATTLPSTSEPLAQTNNPPSSLPPNQIGDDPPRGQSEQLDTNSYPPTDVVSSSTNPMNDTQQIPEPSNAAAPSSSDLPEPKEGHPISSEMRGSKAPVAPVEKPDYTSAPIKPADRAEGTHHREGSIPTAGGVGIGSVAMEQRRMSTDVRRASKDTSRSSEAARTPALGEAGSSSLSPPQPLQHPGAGETLGETSIEEDPSPRTSVQQTVPAEIVAPTEGDTAAGRKSANTETPAAASAGAGESASPSSSSAAPESTESSSTATPGKESKHRHGSLLHKIKEKIKH